MLGLGLLTITLLFTGALSSSHANKSRQIADLAPNPIPHWVPFYGPTFTCANLQVPLDYENETAGTTNIAYIKYTAKNPQAQSILFNPGGPGESGVNFLRTNAKSLSHPIGSQYNFISFDPRGVGQSGLLLSCSPSIKDDKVLTRKLKSVRRSKSPSEFQLAKAKMKSCSAANKHTDAKYAGTVANAQDIAHFLDVNGIRDLWYVGASYGTVLGQTFATMFPDRVGRMVLDSNVDGEGWYTGIMPQTYSNLDSIFEAFFHYCYTAGPECEFFTALGKEDVRNVDTIRVRLRALLDTLKTRPPTYHNVVITEAYDELMHKLFMAMYNPKSSFPEISAVLAALEAGDASLLFNTLVPELDRDTNVLIQNIDSSIKYPIKTYSQYLEARQVYARQSEWAGEWLADLIILQKVGFELTPPRSQRFLGFNPNGTRTKTPILFVNNLRDPVTSIPNARKMSNFFLGSSVLAIDSTFSMFTILSQTLLHLWRGSAVQYDLPSRLRSIRAGVSFGVDAHVLELISSGGEPFSWKMVTSC
jgi:pimeloyl-ACP methyl ester carboxylesterase